MVWCCRCKNLGFGSNRPQHDHVYGVPSMGTAQGEAADEWGAGECLRGDYTGKGQEPDSDLGTTLRPGWRNEVRSPCMKDPVMARIRCIPPCIVPAPAECG